MTTSLYIGIPTHDGRITKECMLGVLSAWGNVPCEIAISTSCYIARARDLISRNALAAPNVSHVLFLDSDIAWSFADLAKLIELDVDFAFGTYPYKDDSGRPMRSPDRGNTMDLKHSRLGLAPGVSSHDWCGGGFVLVKREALALMAESCGTYPDPLSGEEFPALWWSFDRGDVMEGEDIAFCRRWRQLGGQIYTRDDVRLGHVGQKLYRQAMPLDPAKVAL